MKSSMEPGVDHIALSVLLFLAFSLRLTTSSPTFILIQPRTLILSEGMTSGRVVVICRQLPSTPSNPPGSLTIWRQARQGKEDPVILAEVTNGAPFTYRHDNQSQRYTADGDLNTQLALTMPRASCHEAGFSYICKSELLRGEKNTAIATFTAIVETPVLTLTASPTQSVYTDVDTMTLTCSTESPIGVASPGGEGHWMWEYNDVGPWKAVPRDDVTSQPVFTDGCLQTSTYSILKVHMNDFKTCARRFRCYVKTGFDESGDDAEEYLVDRGISCHEAHRFLGTSPALAIVCVLLIIVIISAATYFAFITFRRIRNEKEEKRKEAVAMRILSPLSAEQRDSLLAERMEKRRKELGLPQSTAAKPLKSVLKQRPSQQTEAFPLEKAPTPGKPGTAGTSGKPGTAVTSGNTGTAVTSGKPGTIPTPGKPSTKPSTSGKPGTAVTSGKPGTTPTPGKQGTPTSGKQGTPTSGKQGTPTSGKQGTPTSGKQGTPTSGKQRTPTSVTSGTSATSGKRGKTPPEPGKSQRAAEKSKPDSTAKEGAMAGAGKDLGQGAKMNAGSATNSHQVKVLLKVVPSPDASTSVDSSLLDAESVTSVSDY